MELAALHSVCAICTGTYSSSRSGEGRTSCFRGEREGKAVHPLITELSKRGGTSRQTLRGVHTAITSGEKTVFRHIKLADRQQSAKADAKSHRFTQSTHDTVCTQTSR
jgi:hypothetical protein